MKKLLLMMTLSATCPSASAQGFWAPGACWVYQNLHLSNALERYVYVGDSLVDGQVAQVCDYSVCTPLPSLDTLCVDASALYWIREFTRLEGNVVLHKRFYPNETNWDTLYYLGVPGDRWWPLGADTSCTPFGMIEIQDTSHVVIDGMSLRAWDIALLDSTGMPLPDDLLFGQDTMAIIERIGGTRRSFRGNQCGPDTSGIIVDYAYYKFLHYSDNEIDLSTVNEISCDIVLNSSRNVSMGSQITVHPNPGADQLNITGLTESASVEVRDPLGRMVRSQTSLSANTPIETASWEIGTYFITITQRVLLLGHFVG